MSRFVLSPGMADFLAQYRGPRWDGQESRPDYYSPPADGDSLAAAGSYLPLLPTDIAADAANHHLHSADFDESGKPLAENQRRRVMLRTRRDSDGNRSVYAALGNRYEVHDVNQVAEALSAAVPSHAKGKFVTDGARWELMVSFGSPIEPCVGEIFNCWISVRGADDGSRAGSNASARAGSGWRPSALSSRAGICAARRIRRRSRRPSRRHWRNEPTSRPRRRSSSVSAPRSRWSGAAGYPTRPSRGSTKPRPNATADAIASSAAVYGFRCRSSTGSRPSYRL